MRSAICRLSLSHRHLTILLCLFAILLQPARSTAAYVPPAGSSSTVAQRPEARHHLLPHMRHTHFKGRRSGWVVVLALACSILGSAAVVASFAAVFAASPAGVFVACAYGLNLLGIALGFTHPDDLTANTAVILGCINLLVLIGGGAIYAAIKGDLSKLFNLAYWSTH